MTNIHVSQFYRDSDVIVLCCKIIHKVVCSGTVLHVHIYVLDKYLCPGIAVMGRYDFSRRETDGRGCPYCVYAGKLVKEHEDPLILQPVINEP